MFTSLALAATAALTYATASGRSDIFVFATGLVAGVLMTVAIRRDLQKRRNNGC